MPSKEQDLKATTGNIATHAAKMDHAAKMVDHAAKKYDHAAKKYDHAAKKYDHAAKMSDTDKGIEYRYGKQATADIKAAQQKGNPILKDVEKAKILNKTC